MAVFSLRQPSTAQLPLVHCEDEVHCSPLCDADERHLQALEKHILVAYKRIRALQKRQPWPQVGLSTGSSQNSLAKAEKAPKSGYNDLDRKILQLCGELYDLDAASLQLKVINYVSAFETGRTKTKDNYCP
ncbi:UNVERIFIED_CONTAM: hypothetical protein K2H54_072777 [Gekko kuhli]